MTNESNRYVTISRLNLLLFIMFLKNVYVLRLFNINVL